MNIGDANVITGSKVAYKRLECIGGGTYGKVYRATIEGSDPEVSVAIKKIKNPMKGEGIPGTVLREVALLLQLRHSNIVILQDVIYRNSSLYIVFEHMACDLSQYMRTQHPHGLPTDAVATTIKQVLEGLAYLHAHRVIHRDLKPQNILVDPKTMVIKLCDLGLSRVFHLSLKVYTHEVVTLWYRAPELLLGCEHYTPSIDMWSAGCILSELITGTTIIAGDSEIDQVMKTFRLLGSPTEATWPGVTQLPFYSTQFPKWKARKISATNGQEGDLLKKILILNPGSRLTARGALNYMTKEQVNRDLMTGIQ